MNPLLLLCSFFILLFSTSCSENTSEEQKTQAHDQDLPADVLSVTKPLIGGQLYDEANFESATLTSFDNTQDLQILDTSDVIFTKVRVRKEEKEYVGFIPKAILPE